MKKREFLKASRKGGAVIAAAVFAQAIIGFVTQVSFARLLAPEIFGQIAFASTVALFFNAFTNLRGDAYVIHQKDSPQRAVDVAFTLELIVSTLFVTLVFLIAPSVMKALGKSDLVLFVQLLAFSFFYNPFCLPRCLLERDMSFFYSKFPLLISQLAAAGLSITLAFWGYGIWSLLWWRLSVMLGEVIILWIIAPYRPKLHWDTELAKRFLGFSWPLVGSAILSFFCYNIDYFIVGQFLTDGANQLGYYWLGFQAAAYLLMARQVLHQVLFPIFSRLEDDVFKKQAFIRFSRAVAGVFVVLTVLAIFFGRDAIHIVYGSKWEPAVFPFQIIFIVVMMRAINSNCGYYLYSLGHTRPELISVAIYSVLLAPTAYFCTTYFGINGTAVAVLIVQIIVSIVIYEWYIRPLTSHGVLYFFLWPWIISGLSLLFALGSHHFELSLFIRLILFSVLLAVAYFSILRDALNDVKSAIRILKPMQSEKAIQ